MTFTPCTFDIDTHGLSFIYTKFSHFGLQLTHKHFELMEKGLRVSAGGWTLAVASLEFWAIL